MTRIGITGHRGLNQATASLITAALRELVRHHHPTDLVAVSCLADGADALFARLVLDHGGTLEAIIPATEYRTDLPADYQPAYDDLLAQAHPVHRLDRTRSDPEAHMAASRLMLARIDELAAVWDGQPARAYGGTADVVAEARAQGLPVHVLWPEGATRD